MPRGHPDYTPFNTNTVNIENGNVNSTVFDIGFARQDGGGRVIWFDDFRTGLNRYTLSASGFALTPYLDTSGAAGMGFYPRVILDPVQNGSASRILLNTMTSVTPRVGIETSVFLPTNHCIYRYEFTAAYAAGFNWRGSLRIVNGTSAVQLYYDGNWRDVLVPDAPQDVSIRWIQFKLVFDLDAGKYSAFYIGGRRVTLGQDMISGPPFGLSGGLTVMITGETGIQSPIDPVYMSNIILTADEP